MAQPQDKIFASFPEIRDAPPLSINDLGYVLRVIHDAGLVDKWREIAQSLTVSGGDLDGFHTTFSGDQSLCLLHSMAAWLNGQKRSRNPATWCEVVRAVADPAGGGKQLEAKRIAKNYKDRGGLSKFTPLNRTHAKDTPPTLLRDDLSDNAAFIFKEADDALDNLMVDLTAVASRWIHIGALLGPDITFAWLSIQTSGNHQQILRDMLATWMDSIGEVTLQRLVEAVEHSAGGKNPAVANTIKDKCAGDAAPIEGGGTAGGGATGGGTTGGSATGGSATGGNATGGNATGGNATGGNATGGNATGGSATGGSATGGSATGGSATGGSATGGSATGGSATGGSATGGSATGGNAAGGDTAGAMDSPPKRGDKANLTLLMDFPGRRGKFNIPRRITTNYTTFGIALLRDDDGARLTAIARQNMGNSYDINNQILMDWIAGQGIPDTTWGGLIKVLRSPCRLNALADDIEAVVGR